VVVAGLLVVASAVAMLASPRSVMGGRATMQVKVLGAIPVVDARGEVWEPVDERNVRARFTHGEHTISATLLFGDDGLLANFISDDRSRASADGMVFTWLRFLTPVHDYRDFGPMRLAAHGEARWLLPEGEFTYGEFDLESISYNTMPSTSCPARMLLS
jgi:hypothetical protein